MTEPTAQVVEAEGEQASQQAHAAPRWPLFRRGIGLRLLALILMFSSVVTLTLTAVQLGFDYRRDVGAIENRLAEIETSYANSLGAGLWNVDLAQLELQLQGILRLPDIRAVELREEAAEVARPLRLAAGQRGDGAAMARTYPITYDNRGTLLRVGTLYVEASLEAVYQRLWDTAKLILLTQAVKTFLVSTFILYLVYLLVTRHLAAIAGELRRFDLRNHTAPLRLNRKAPERPDELDQVVNSFNAMRVDLQRAWSDLQKANEELEHGLHLRRRYEAQLQHQAHYDSLTNLPNRFLLLERLHYVLARTRRLGGRGALLCIDLDRFKNVNDIAGHSKGDELLKEAAGRLASCMREQDTLARLGGDEFSVILDQLDHDAAAEELAGRILERFSAPFNVAGHPHYVTASIGITLFPDDNNDAHVLLRNAELAMYKAKEAGRNRHQRFDEGFNRALAEQLGLEEQLRGALAGQQLELHYQPIVALASGEVVAHEALLRWRLPDGQLRMPDRFIPQAEDMGLITAFGAWVLASACADLAQDALPLRVAINVSPHQLQEADFAQQVATQLRRHGLRPEQVELEITERVVMDDSPATAANLKALDALGVRISIDDFGTGYSSLAYLQKYPFDTLKIDRSFVAAALDHPGAARLVETIIAMGHGLEMDVIAEGVETEAQRDFLIAAGCDLAQGWLYGRPAARTPAQRQDRTA